MNTEIITNLTDCKKLWEKFRKDTNIWAEWEIVMSFFDEKLHKPHFILIKEGSKEIGLIPLWLDLRDNKYTHFGGERMENRTFWVDDICIPEIHKLLPVRTHLFDLNGEHMEKIMAINPEIQKIVTEKDTRYFLNLENIKSIEEYLARFGKKHKKNLLRDLKMLEPTNYKIVWEHDNKNNSFIELSISRFKEESDFHDADNKQEMLSFTNLLEKKNMLYSLLLEINGKVEAAEIAALYKDHYYVINGGFNPEIKNLGKVLIIEHIKKAIELGAKEIDFLVGDSGWKELWNLDKDSCYTIRKQQEISNK
jgi:hypothetical protein